MTINYEKSWIDYVLETIDEDKLNQIIIDIKCSVEGYRSGKKGLKKAPRIKKVYAIQRSKAYVSGVSCAILKIYQDLYEQEEIREYIEMTPAKFIEQIEVFKTKESTDVQIAVSTYFLGSGTQSEKEEIMSYYCSEEIEQGLEEVASALDCASESVVIDTLSKDTKENEDTDVEQVPLKEEKLTTKQKKLFKNEIKMLKESCQKLKNNEEVHLKNIEKLKQNLEQANKSHTSEIESYQKQIKNLHDELEKKSQQYTMLESQKQQVEKKAESKKVSMDYIFIGSAGVRKKIEALQSKYYSDVEIIYLSPKQWEDGMGGLKEEVKGVYGLHYDLEWFVRTGIKVQYDEKVKIFDTYKELHNYIEQYWGK